MVRKLDALVDDLSRKRVLHVQVPEHLVMATVEAPATELDIIVVRDVEALAEYEPRSEAVRSKLRAAQPERLISLWYGVAIGDVLTSVCLAGWNSVEVCVSVMWVILKNAGLIGEYRTTRGWHPKESRESCERYRGSSRTTCLSSLVQWSIIGILTHQQKVECRI